MNEKYFVLKKSWIIHSKVLKYFGLQLFERLKEDNSGMIQIVEPTKIKIWLRFLVHVVFAISCQFLLMLCLFMKEEIDFEDMKKFNESVLDVITCLSGQVFFSVLTFILVLNVVKFVNGIVEIQVFLQHQMPQKDLFEFDTKVISRMVYKPIIW